VFADSFHLFPFNWSTIAQFIARYAILWQGFYRKTFPGAIAVFS